MTTVASRLVSLFPPLLPPLQPTPHLASRVVKSNESHVSSCLHSFGVFHYSYNKIQTHGLVSRSCCTAPTSILGLTCFLSRLLLEPAPPVSSEFLKHTQLLCPLAALHLLSFCVALFPLDLLWLASCPQDSTTKRVPSLPVMLVSAPCEVFLTALSTLHNLLVHWFPCLLLVSPVRMSAP